jgi:putative transposase
MSWVLFGTTGAALAQNPQAAERMLSVLIYVNPAYTSQTCSRCGHIHPGNRKSQAEFVCLSCGFTANADLNAAINIKRAGHAQLACQANGAVMPSATGTSRLAA